MTYLQKLYRSAIKISKQNYKIIISRSENIALSNCIRFFAHCFQTFFALYNDVTI